MDNAKDKHSDEVCNECIVRDSDRNKKKLFSCKFCNEMLCLEHSNAKLILTQYKITTASRNIQRLYEQNYREKGHPCQEYDDYWHDQINKKQEQERNSLDKLLASGRLNKKNNSGGLDNDWRTYENADSDGNQIKIKKSTVAIIVLIIFAVCVFFLLPKFIGSGIPNPFEKTCTDKTISGACSINKPYKCVNGNLIYDALSCGCSEGQIVENAACRSLRSCSDGTQHNTCSINKPDFCNDGILTANPTLCGCQQGFRNYNNKCIVETRCSDGTFSPECSSTEPYICQNETLIEKSSICGCPVDTIKSGESCVDKYMTIPTTRTFPFTFRGQNYNLNITLYGGLNDYLTSQQGWTYWHSAYETPSQEEVSKIYAERWINQPNQERLVEGIVTTIQNFSSNKDDQARVAISLVQNIPYDWEGFNSNANLNKYPYQVLYSNTGVCGEKSQLLALLLKKLGFGVALLEYPLQNHEAVGIRCPSQYVLSNTSYCFVESTIPNIPTYDQGEYAGVGRLTSSPNVIVVSQGRSFDSIAEEYADSNRLIEIEDQGRVLDQQTYREWLNLVQKYGLKFDNSN